MLLGATESLIMQMEILTKANGRIIRRKVMGYFRTKTRRSMKANGKRICRMAKAKKLGKMEAIMMANM